jgi:hypothetical protein
MRVRTTLGKKGDNMILSKTRPKIIQVNALSKARAWARSNNLTMCKRAVKEAAAAYPISEIQWFNLLTIVGHEALRELKQIAGAARPTQ